MRALAEGHLGIVEAHAEGESTRPGAKVVVGAPLATPSPAPPGLIASGSEGQLIGIQSPFLFDAIANLSGGAPPEQVHGAFGPGADRSGGPTGARSESIGRGARDGWVEVYDVAVSKGGRRVPGGSASSFARAEAPGRSAVEAHDHAIGADARALSQARGREVQADSLAELRALSTQPASAVARAETQGRGLTSARAAWGRRSGETPGRGSRARPGGGPRGGPAAPGRLGVSDSSSGRRGLRQRQLQPVRG